MIRYITYDKNGIKDYIVLTTRKANYSDHIFGKMTFWGSKEKFDKGDCRGVYTAKDIYLGTVESYIPIEADKFIEKAITQLNNPCLIAD